MVNDYSSPKQGTSNLWGITCHMGSYSVICHQWTHPILTPGRWVVFDLPIAQGWKAELTQATSYIPRRSTHPQMVIHPSLLYCLCATTKITTTWVFVINPCNNTANKNKPVQNRNTDMNHITGCDHTTTVTHLYDHEFRSMSCIPLSLLWEMDHMLTPSLEPTAGCS